MKSVPDKRLSEVLLSKSWIKRVRSAGFRGGTVPAANSCGVDCEVVWAGDILRLNSGCSPKRGNGPATKKIS